MLIAINLDVIDSEHLFRELDRLLMLFESEQHQWYLDEKVDELMSRAWPTQLSNRHQSILKTIAEKAYVQSITVSKKEKRDRGLVSIEVNGDSSLQSLMPMLDDPLFIVIENETSDSMFLNRLFEIYPIHGLLLKKARQKAHLTYYPAGGRNETLKTLYNLARKKQQPYRPRVFVFLDSDKKYPGQPNDVHLQRIVDYCTEEGISFHILFKREIENYLPKEILQRRIPETLSPIAEEVCRLNPNQWDFYDLEKGFNDRQPPDTDPIFSEFSGRGNVRYNVLRHGFHRNKVYTAKQELYKLVQFDEFRAETLNSRCAHQPDKDELINLLLRIKNRL